MTTQILRPMHPQHTTSPPSTVTRQFYRGQQLVVKSPDGQTRHTADVHSVGDEFIQAGVWITRDQCRVMIFSKETGDRLILGSGDEQYSVVMEVA